MANFIKGIPNSPKDDIKKYDETMKGIFDSLNTPEGSDSISEEQIQADTELIQYRDSLDPEQKERIVSEMAQREIHERDTPSSKFSRDRDQELPFDQGEVLKNMAYQTIGDATSSVGTFVSGVGDMVTFATHFNPLTRWTLNLGDPIGNTLRKLGGGLESYGTQHVYKDLEKFTWDDLANPRFWTSEVAKLVPDAIGMLYGGTLIARGATKLSSKLARKAIRSGKITPGVSVGGTVIKKGKGIGRFTSTPGGKTTGANVMGNVLTKEGQMIASGVGGGFGMNMLDGARIAGNSYNDALNQGFSREEAGSIATNIWVDNLWWMAFDMASFGIAYSKIGANLFKKSINKAVNNTNKSFGPRVSSFLIPKVKTLGIAGFEGTEEYFQENYQDWRVKKNFAIAKGEDYMGYWDYLETDEAKKTGALSFILGAGLGGGKSVINNMAERNRKSENKADYLNMLMNSDIDDMQKKYQTMNYVVAGAFAYNKVEEVEEYLSKMLEENKIDQDSYNEYIANLEESSKVIENTPFVEEMTEEIKEQYFLRSLNVSDLQKSLGDVDVALQDNISKIESMEGMTDSQKEAAKNAAIQDAENSKAMIQQEIDSNETAKAAIVNSVITRKDSEGRTFYREGVTQDASGKKVSEGQMALEKTPQLTETEKSKYTKKGQYESLEEAYKERAIKNLEKEGLEPTEENILTEMKRIEGTKEGFSIRKTFMQGLRSARDMVKAGYSGVKAALSGGATVVKAAAKLTKVGVDVVKGIHKGIKQAYKSNPTKEIWNEKGQFTNPSIIDNILKDIDSKTGSDLSSLSTEDKLEFIKQLFPDNNLEKIANMNEQEFNEYYNQKIQSISEETEQKQSKSTNEVFKRSSMEEIINGWLNTPEGSLENQTAEESAKKFASEYIKRNQTSEEQAEKEFGKSMVKQIFTGLNIYETVLNEIKKQVKSVEDSKSKKEIESIMDKMESKTPLTKKEKTLKEKHKKEIQKRLKAKKESVKKKDKKKEVKTQEKTEKIDKDIESVEIESSKKHTKEITPKKSKTKRPDPLGNKDFKVDSDRDVTPNIDRMTGTSYKTSVMQTIRYFRNKGGQMDKTAIVVLDELSNTIPYYSLGQAMGSSVFIRGNQAWQDILAHEYGGHIFYRAYSHTDAVKNGVANLIGTDLWKETKELYYNLRMFAFTNPLTGETNNMTIEDISWAIYKLASDKRTRFYKSNAPEYRNIRESLSLLLQSKTWADRQQSLKRLEAHLRAAEMTSDVVDSKQEALKEEVWSISTEESSKDRVIELLGGTKKQVVKKHEGYAKRFWNKVKRQFGNDKTSEELLNKTNPELNPQNKPIKEVGLDLSKIYKNNKGKHTVNTYSFSSNMLNRDLIKSFGHSSQNVVREWVSKMNSKLLDMSTKKDKKLLTILESKESLDQFVSESFKSLKLPYTEQAFGKDGLNKITTFIKPMIQYHASKVDPTFKNKVKELTAIDIVTDLNIRSEAGLEVSKEVKDEVNKEYIDEQTLIVKTVSMIDDFMIRQGMDPDNWLENMEGDGKVDYELQKGGEQAVSSTVQRLIKLFTKEQYSKIQKEIKETTKDGETVEIESYTPISKSLRNAKVLQGDLLLAGISSRTNAYEFIDIVRSSENVQTIQFLNWLENKLGSKEQADAFLMMMHKEFSDRVQERIVGIYQTEDEQGDRQFITKELFGFHESNLIENTNKMMNSFYNKKHIKESIDKRRTDEILKITEATKKGINNRTAINILKMITSKTPELSNYIDWTSIAINGVTINGKTSSISQAVENILTKKGTIYKKGKGYYLKTKNIEPLIEELVIKSRKKAYVTLVNNIEGKPTNITNKSSYLTRRVESINELFTIPENETDQEWEERTSKLLKDTEFNIFTWLGSHGQEIEIAQSGGMASEVNNQSSTYQRMTGPEVLLGDMSEYFNNYDKDNVTSYWLPISVFAEKSRREMIKARLFNSKSKITKYIKKLDYLADLTYTDGTVVFPLLTKDGNINQSWLNDQVKLHKEFIKKNPSLFKNKTFRLIVDPKTGKLKKGADKHIELMIMNYQFNRIQAQRLLIGRHEQFENVTDYTKRAAGSIARSIPFDKNIRMDVVQFEDIYKYEDQFYSESEMNTKIEEEGLSRDDFSIATDGAMYVLPEQAQHIKDEYGELNDFGEHFKFVYYGNSKNSLLPNNKQSYTEPTYLKGNTFVLTEEAVKDSTYLQNIKKVLEKRNSVFEGESESYTNSFPIAVAGSAVKTSYGIPKHSVSAQNEISSTEINEISDIQFDAFKNEKGFFEGLRGSDFGVQLILDTKERSAPLSIQMFSNLMINGNNHESKILSVLNNFALSMKHKSNKKASKVKAKNLTEGKRANKNIMKTIGDWAGSSNKELAKTASPLFPKNNIIKNSIGGNIIAQNGSRMYLEEIIDGLGAGVRAYQAAEGRNLKAYSNIKSNIGDVWGSQFIAPQSLKKLGYKKGDIIIGTRIPGKSKADHFLLVIEDFHSEGEGSKITLPSEISKVIGSDLDGDAVFLSGKYKNLVGKSTKGSVTSPQYVRYYNKAIDGLIEILQEPEFRTNEIQKELDIKDDSDWAIKDAEDNLGINLSEEVNLNTPLGDMEIFENNVPARGLIGLITNMARDMHYFSFHNVGLNTSITINGKKVERFSNDDTDSYFPVSQSQNVALDNAKHLFAKKLGLNMNTVKSYVMLQRLGFSTSEVVTIMNSEAMQMYNKHANIRMVTQRRGEKINIDPSIKALYELENKGRNVEDDLVDNLEKREAWKKVKHDYPEMLKNNPDDNIDIDFDNIKKNPKRFNLQVLKLIYNLNNTTKEIQKVSRLLSLYKNYPKDSHAANKMLNDLDDLINSKESNLNVSDLNNMIKSNPILNRNLEVLYELQDQYENTNIIDSKEAQEVNKVMEEISNETNPFGTHPRVPRSYSFRKMEQSISFLKNIKSKEELLEVIQQARLENPENIALNESISLLGQKNYETNEYEVSSIRINKSYINEYTSSEMIQDYRESFSELPTEVQKAIIQLDYIDNKWAGGTTAYIWSQEVWDQLNPELEQIRIDSNENIASREELEQISLDIIVNHPRLIPVVSKGDIFDASGKNWKFIPNKRNKQINELQSNDKKHYVKKWDSGLGKYVALEYIGKQRYKALSEVSKDFAGETTSKKIEKIKKNVDTFKEKGYTNLSRQELKDIFGMGSNMIRPYNRKKAKDYTHPDFFTQLTKEEWAKRKGIDLSKVVKGSDSDIEIQRQYGRYINDILDVQNSYFILSNPENMEKITSEELVDLAVKYNDPSKFEKEVSKVMEGLISVELANRAAKEQSKITGTGPQTAGVNDVSSIKQWLMSNNISSDHPAVQNLVKQMEIEHNKYSKAYSKHAAKIERLERKLDKHMSQKYGWPVKLKLLFQGKWADLKYANLIREVKEADGTSYIELLDESELDKNKVSQAEIEFLREFKYVMKKFGKTKEGYIPHVMMGGYESLMKRGLFGLYNSSLGNTSKINHIKVEGLGPSGREIRTFGEWRQIYERGGFNKNGRRIQEFEKIKIKAKQYLKEGKDAEGNEIGLSLVEIRGLLGSDIFKDFASSKQIKLSELGIKDLGKISKMFIRASVFANGDVDLENSTGFRGMKRMAPLIDGLIRVYKDNNNPKMAKYIEEVWRDGYLRNRKQETFGKVGDKIIDLIVKHTLYIALGFGIIPAIGNVLIGKYNQIRSKGSGEFAVGEKRFWNPETFKRNQLIIEQVMQQEYNVFDDIYSVNERSWIDRLVFWPMNASEKWIQGSAFLATFTEEELNEFKFSSNGELLHSPISQEEAIKRYDKIKREQGRGFSPSDQRLMGMYSWGRAMLQFTRWLPTLVNERFGKETVNRYGEVEIGSYTAAAQYGRDLIIGNKTWADFNTLPEAKKTAIRKWFRGVKLTMAVGILAIMVGGEGDDENKVDQLYDDIMIFTDYDRLAWTVTPAASFTAANYMEGIKNVATGARAERPGKYLEAGEKKWKTNLYKSLPSPLISERESRTK